MTPKLCMFCAQAIESSDLTMEHFAPKGLWEKKRRPKGTKTLPAHKNCNAMYSDDNEYFRDVLVLESGAERNEGARRVREGAIRRKLETRVGSLAKTLKNARVRRVRTPAGLELGEQPAFEVDLERVERVLCNIIKGIYYVSQKKPLPSDFFIGAGDVRQFERASIAEVARMMVPWQSFGDAVFTCRYVVSSREGLEKMSCLMRFYENRIFYGEALAPAYLERGDSSFVPARPGSPIVVPRWVAES